MSFKINILLMECHLNWSDIVPCVEGSTEVHNTSQISKLWENVFFFECIKAQKQLIYCNSQKDRNTNLYLSNLNWNVCFKSLSHVISTYVNPFENENKEILLALAT